MKAATLTALIAALMAALVIPIALPTRDQTPPTLDDTCSSAVLPFGTMTVNVDITENDALTLPGEASVFYSLDGQASWSEALLSHAGGTLGDTWEASFSVGSGDVHYYIMAHDDSAAAFGAPVNTANAYPPGVNLTADPADEPGGDAVDHDTNSLDLNGARFGYSDTHLYGSLSNMTGSWPTSGGIFGPWYAYTVAIANPDATGDVGFAMVYADVPILLPSGLYRVALSDSSYTRIGDIDHTIQGGDLHLRCSLALLYAQPEFGSQNPSGYYLTGAGTGTVTLAEILTPNDYTSIYAFYRRTDLTPVDSNTSPVLSDPGYGIVTAPETRDAAVNFFVTYSDADGNLPVERSLVLDGAPLAMATGPDHDYAAGVQFELGAMLSPDDHTYFYRFSDGVATVTTDVDTIHLATGVPDVVAGRATIHSVWPQPSRGEATVSFSVPSGRIGRVDIYDALGRRVRALWLGAGGEHDLSWDGRDDGGRDVASGIYFVHLSCGCDTDRAKLAVVR